MRHTLILPIIKKELIHIRRDTRSLVILFLMPLLMMFLFGYAIDMDLKNIRLGIVDWSKTKASRDLIQKIDASRYFNVVSYFEDAGKIHDYFKQRSISAALVIKKDFARDLEKGSAEVGIIIDGSDANTATIIQNYLEGILLPYSFSLSVQSSGLPVLFKPLVLYNPEMISVYFTVPGILAILLMMIGALLTSVTLVREKETGTLEQVLVSPIKSHEMIIGKAFPYFILASVIALSILGVGYYWFNVPFLGSPLLLAFFCSVYILTSLALGLLISTLVSTQSVAMMIALVGTMLPSIMLSGFIFPVASMPLPLQMISKLIPATPFLVIVRGIMLKGNGFAELWLPGLQLLIIGLILMKITIKRFTLKLK